MSRKLLSSPRRTAALPVLTGMFLGLSLSLGPQLTAQSTAARAIQPMPRVLGPVDPAVMTTLKGNTMAFARAVNDRGRVPDATPTGRLLLQLRPSAEQQEGLHKLLAAQQDAKSPSFHKWLTVAEYAKQFGAADADIQAVTGYLSQQGFSVARVLPNKTAIEFSGTTGQLRTAFKTEMHSYSVHGQTFVANDRDPQVPAALAAVVAGIPALNNYRPAQKAGPLSEGVAQQVAGPGRGKVHAMYTDSNLGAVAVSPGDLASIYDIPASATGAGVTIGIVGTSTVNLTYYQNYRTTFGLGPLTPSVIIDGDDPGTGSESYLDLAQMELASAVAPKAAINYYTSASTDVTTGLNLALIRAINDDAVQVLIITQENCEANLGISDNQFIGNAAEFGSALGITVIAKSGNGGSAACDSGGGDGTGATEQAANKGLAVSGYASSPYVTAVGATDFYYPPGSRNQTYLLQCCWNAANGGSAGYTSAKGYIPEQPWNDSNTVNNGRPFSVLVASGGGVSTLGGVSADGSTSIPYPEPSWQLPVVPASITTTARAVPDVSMFGADGEDGSIYMTCVQAGECVNGTPSSINYGFGAGTEAAAAVFGGVAALIDQAHGPQGNINPTLYSMYTTTPSAFHDIVQGTNTIACTSGSPNCGSDGYMTTGAGQAYVAAAGYDAASGLGSVDVANLINNWNPPNTATSATTFTLTAAGTSTPITSFVHGTTVQANISVSGASGTPTGDVAVVTGSAAPANTAITSAPLVNGSVVLTQPVSGLPGGTYPISARYGGDATYASSLSAPTTVTVSPETSKVEIVSLSFTQGSSVAYGTPVTVKLYVFSATNPNSIGTPTGALTVSDIGGQTLPNVSLDAQGFATFTAVLPVGAHSLSFSYGGDISYQASSLASSVTLTVNAQSTTTTLTSSNTNDGTGDYVQLVAVVNTSVNNGGALTWPTGTISFQTVGNGARTLGTSTVVPAISSSGQLSAVANFQMVGSGLPNNPTLVTAIYKPAATSNYSTSISPNLSITKNSAAGLFTSTVGLTTSDAKTSYFDYSSAVTLNLTIAGGGTKPTGTISLYDNGVLLPSHDGTASPGTLTLSSSSSAPTYTISADVNTGILPLTIGRNVITAQYNGDLTHATSTRSLAIIILDEKALPDFSLQTSSSFAVLTPSVTSSTFTLQLTSVNNFASFGQKVSFAAAAPTGITCSFSPASVTFVTTATSATDTLTCGASSGYTVAGLAPAPTAPGRFWMATGGVTLACAFLLGIPARRKAWRQMAGSGLALLLTLGLTAGILSGCSSNAAGLSKNSLSADAKAGAKPKAGGVLAKGTYQVLIEATAPFATNVQANTSTLQTHTLPIQIVVQ